MKRGRTRQLASEAASALLRQASIPGIEISRDSREERAPPKKRCHLPRSRHDVATPCPALRGMSGAAADPLPPCPQCGSLPATETLPRLTNALAPHGELLTGHRPTTEGSAAPAPMTPLTAISDAPPQIPGYEVLGVLGRGGMGLVYRGAAGRPQPLRCRSQDAPRQGRRRSGTGPLPR